MREILFRAKRIDNHEWVYGARLPRTKTICTERTYPNSTEYIDLFVDPETVGQYTGLHDDNGNRIFEGDIVCARYIDNGRQIQGVVNYFYGAFCVKCDDRNNPAIDMLWCIELKEE